MQKTIIVIGAGQAAASFLARFRQKDQDTRIVLIGDEQSLPYQRPPLSKKYATGEMTADQLMLRAEDWYTQNNIECRLGQSVVEINRDEKTLTTGDGDVLSWDGLMLATGSTPRNLPGAIGGNLDGVTVLRSIKDADWLSGKLQPGRRVAIIGGGYIGLEAAAVCAMKGLEVTVIEAADRILQRVACEATSNWFRKLHQSHGVTIREACSLDRLEARDGRVSSAVLADGEEIPVDFVLVGIGIIPNMLLAQEAGLEVAGGIKVNDHCQTSDPDIYAAGDCAAFTYRGEPTRLESVQNAIDQAECAADNMAGEARAYRPYPWFWSDQYGVKLQIAGLNRGHDHVVERAGDREGSMSHFYFAGEQLLAVDAMNDPRTYMVVKKMLEAGKNITPQQAADTQLQLKSLM